MSKREKIQKWDDIFKENHSGLPAIIGGMPRGGTTFAYRNLWSAHPDPKPYFLEEYMHYYYVFDYNEHEPKISVNIDKIAAQLNAGKIINGGGDPQILVNRYEKLLQTGGIHKGFMKVFPYHLDSLKNGSEEYFEHILKNHWWIMIIRPDWINCMFSNIYSNYFNKFHYYDKQQLIVKEFTATTRSAENFLKQFRLLYDQQKLQDHRKFFYTDQITDLPNIFFKIIDKAMTSPRLDRQKPELFKNIITNYDSIVEFATDKMNNEIAEYTNGWITLDSNNEIYINEAKR